MESLQPPKKEHKLHIPPSQAQLIRWFSLNSEGGELWVLSSPKREPGDHPSRPILGGRGTTLSVTREQASSKTRSALTLEGENMPSNTTYTCTDGRVPGLLRTRS